MRLLRLLAYKVLLIGCLVGGVYVWVKWEYHLPPEQRVRERFEARRSDFVRFAALLRKEHHPCFISRSGKVSIGSEHPRYVSEYRELAHAVGAKFVTISEDGIIQFALWGFGGPLLDDSYEGVRYYPGASRETRGLSIVTSLDALPRQRDRVIPGYYVVPVEPGWDFYRFEYLE